MVAEIGAVHAAQGFSQFADESLPFEFLPAPCFQQTSACQVRTGGIVKQ
jgi:hypothetical protein